MLFAFSEYTRTLLFDVVCVVVVMVCVNCFVLCDLEIFFYFDRYW